MTARQPKPARPPTSVRVEALTQLALMLGVGTVAACASWSHVVDLAARHGQPGWLAFADAAVLETLAVSMGLEVRRRRRSGGSVVFAGSVLVAAVALQLCAQVAQAPRTFWGWTMAALPAVGFLLLAKVAMNRAPGTPDELAQATEHAAIRPADRPVRQRRPAPAATPVTAEPVEREPTGSGSAVAAGDGGGTGIQPAATDDALLAAGREVVQALAKDGIPLTRAALARGLRERGVRVGTGRAGELLATLRSEQAADAHLRTSPPADPSPRPESAAEDRAEPNHRPDRPVIVLPARGIRP